MNEFIKVGNIIKVKPKIEGLTYNLLPNKIYNLKGDAFKEETWFEEADKLNIPKKLYELKGDNEFINKVLLAYDKNNTDTLGVLLSGTKGTGKSILAKRIALKSNLPIILVNNEFPRYLIEKAFRYIDTEVCIIIDEIDKIFEGKYTYLLTFLDGIEKTTKKLIILTCNDVDKLDENLLDRCSRIRYHKIYDDTSNLNFVTDILKDKGLTEKEKELITNFIKDSVKIKSFDNINSLINEFVLFKDKYDLATLARDLNITLE